MCSTLAIADRGRLLRFAAGLGLLLLAVDGVGCWRYVERVLAADADHARALIGNGRLLLRPLLLAQLGYLVVWLLALSSLYPAWALRRWLVLPVGLLWLLQLPASRPGLLDLAARYLPHVAVYTLYPAWLGWLLQLLWWAWILIALHAWCRLDLRLGGALILAAALWLAWPALGWPGHPYPLAEPERPNILILAADSLRADRLGAYGHRRPTSPALDALAASGVRFDAAYTDAGGTLPAWATLLGGRSSPRHGLRCHFPPAGALARFAGDPDRLPARLARSGYRTAVSSDWAGDCFRQVDFGFDTVRSFSPRGLTVYLLEGLYICHPLLPAVLCRTPAEPLLPGLSRARALLYPEWLADQTVGLIERMDRGSQPFLLVHFGSSPHYPYLAARQEAGRFAAPGYRGRSRFRLAWSIDRLLFSPWTVPEPERRQALALYDASIATFDRRADRILRALSRCRRPSVVVLLSDHGEAFFDKPGLVGHGTDFAPGDPVYRIPLVIRAPGLPPGRVSGVVRTIDLAPTIAELAGLPPAARWEGHSLVRAMRTGTPDAAPACAETTYLMAPGRYPWSLVPRSGDRPTLQRSAGPPEYLSLRPDLLPAVLASKLQMIRTERHKLLRIPTAKGPLVLLFDTAADPRCRRDLSRSLPGVRDTLLRQLDRWCDPPPD